MARRNRTRSRSRREALATRRATTPRPADEAASPRPTGYRARGSVARLGYSRAAGAPSAALERASVLERAYVVKDFRRLGITVAIVLALLIAAGLVETAILGR
jgi:hypothetical protein